MPNYLNLREYNKKNVKINCYLATKDIQKNEKHRSTLCSKKLKKSNNLTVF
jgi:hypothetical protein